MSRSRRLGAATALPAVALAAVLVLAPATAFAAEGDPVEVGATTGSDATTTVAPTEAAVTPATTDASVPSTGTDAIVPSDQDATSASGSETAPADTDAPVDDPAPADAAPVETAAPAEDAPADEAPIASEPVVFGDDFEAHPGTVLTVRAVGFTPADPVTVTVTGDGVPSDADWASVPRFLVYGLDDGSASTFVSIPADFPVGGVVTVTFSDAHELAASADFDVTPFAAAPHLEPPVDATAGVVTVSGENAVPGGYALVELYDAEDAPIDDEPTQFAAAADEPGDEVEPVLVDVDPVPYETTGGAVTVVPVDATGRFSARFVLPAGDFAADALTFDADQTTFSDFSNTVVFSVAPAVTVPAATNPGTVAPAALPVRPVAAVTPARATSLAYTGSEPAGALTWALGAVLAGAGALVAGRLRLRRR